MDTPVAEAEVVLDDCVVVAGVDVVAADTDDDEDVVGGGGGALELVVLGSACVDDVSGLSAGRATLKGAQGPVFTQLPITSCFTLHVFVQESRTAKRKSLFLQRHAKSLALPHLYFPKSPDRLLPHAPCNLCQLKAFTNDYSASSSRQLTTQLSKVGASATTPAACMARTPNTAPTNPRILIVSREISLARSIRYFAAGIQPFVMA